MSELASEQASVTTVTVQQQQQQQKKNALSNDTKNAQLECRNLFVKK